jgi:TusA-related sulfurtransferase
VTEQLLTRMIDAIGAADAGALGALLDPDVRLRALLPSREVDLTGAGDVAREMAGWFSSRHELVVADARVDKVGDLWHAGYRFLVRSGDDTPMDGIVEQQVYCSVGYNVINALRLVCSGVRPLGAAALVAHGETCATLTPHIAAEIGHLSAGQVLTVVADDPAAPEGIAAWSRLTGHALVARRGDHYYLRRA